MIEKRVITEETKKQFAIVAQRGNEKAKRHCTKCKRAAEKYKAKLNKLQSEINGL